MIQDILQDVIKYVHGVGVFPAVRVVQTKDGVEFYSISQDKSVVLNATSKLKFSDDELVFGLGNLDLLNKILDCPEYEENVHINLTKDSQNRLSNIEFENANGDFNNHYRLMSSQMLDTNGVKQDKFLGAKWATEFPPPVASVQRFNLQAAMNSSESSFVIKSSSKNIEVSFGTPATHSGKFVFASNVNGKVIGDVPFSIPVFQKVLNLSTQAETATLKIGERSIMCMQLNSGLVEYNYYILGLSK